MIHNHFECSARIQLPCRQCGFQIPSSEAASSSEHGECHRYLPLAWLELPGPLLLDGADTELSLGFLLDAMGSLEPARGAPEPLSFMTIFAWISSSLDALTCLGQNRVTNLS